MIYDLLAPKSENWYAKINENKEENWIEFIFLEDKKKYYSYKVMIPENENVETVKAGLLKNIKYDFIPPIFYDIKYYSKIKVALGYVPPIFKLLEYLKKDS